MKAITKLKRFLKKQTFSLRFHTRAIIDSKTKGKKKEIKYVIGTEK